MNKENIVSKVNEIYNVIDSIESISRDFRFDLLAGKSGEILFKVYYHKYFNTEYKNLNADLITVIDSIETSRFVQGGLSGIAGVLYLLYILEEVYAENEDIEELTEQIENLVVKDLSKFLQDKNFDYLHGAIGIINILLYKSEKFNKQINSFIDLMYEDYNKVDNMVRFSKFDRSNLNYVFTKDYSNSSLSHGVSAIIITITKIFNKKIKIEKCEVLIKNFIELLDKFQIINQKSIYTNLLPNKNDSTRLAWCIGDLGISLAYWNAGKSLKEESLKNKSIQIIEYCSARVDLENNLVYDSGFCHGTAGIAHVFYRFYEKTGIKELRNVSSFWINETLKMAKFEDGLAGYKAWQGQDGWCKEYGLLEGISGIGLVLLNFLSNESKNMNWDNCFLVD